MCVCVCVCEAVASLALSSDHFSAASPLWFPSVLPWVPGSSIRCVLFRSSFTFIKRLFSSSSLSAIRVGKLVGKVGGGHSPHNWGAQGSQGLRGQGGAGFQPQVGGLFSLLGVPLPVLTYGEPCSLSQSCCLTPANEPGFQSVSLPPQTLSYWD